jgi:hypothetical protein
MKYILIQNDGEIESNSFELIGASTKRDEAGKIGFFGSGLKYSIAYMIRKNISFRIFSGRKELKFSTSNEKLKGKDFDRITINGKETSYTTTMGPTWDADWFVLREIYCNALDEGSCTLVKETENVSASEGKTRIYIQLTQTLAKVIAHWDAYFSDEREPKFVNKAVGTSYMGTGDGGEYVPIQQISVYAKTEGVIYRRGIRVSVQEKLMYDYGLSHVTINEDRTAKYPDAITYVAANLIAQFSDESYVRSILRCSHDDSLPREYYALMSTQCGDEFSEKWIEFSKNTMLVVKELSGKFTEEIRRTKKEVFYIPNYFAKQMKKAHESVSILGMSGSIGEHGYSEMDASPKINFLIKEVIAALKEMKYVVPYDIKIVDFDNDEMLGQADLKNKIILISIKTFDMGRREIAQTIMEECEHINSGKEDYSRAFQNHLLSQWLKSMEDSNAIFL